jgi:tyrosyl-tRNA synthetase
VRNKLEKGDGMSFAEFSYPLLQGWDWWHLFSNYDTQIQVGGSDQYGNIVAGMDAVKYIAQNQYKVLESRLPNPLDSSGVLKHNHQPIGITTPLLTTTAGDKIGKSAGNAMWLSASMTSSFDLYGVSVSSSFYAHRLVNLTWLQFLLRIADTDVEMYLKLFTFVELDEISRIMQEHNIDPGKRKAQHLLAQEVLRLVHGQGAAQQTTFEHWSMRRPDALVKSSATGGQGTAPASVRLKREEVIGAAWGLVLQSAGIASSRSEAGRMMVAGSIYVARGVGSDAEAEANQFIPVKNPRAAIQNADLCNGKLLLRIGKWKVRVIELVDE